MTDYFAAPSDSVAATAAFFAPGQLGLLDFAPEEAAARKARYRDDPQEASRPRVEAAQSGTLLVMSSGIDPAVVLGRLEEIVTGRSADEVNADPRQSAVIAPAEEEIEGVVVVSVTDSLRDALASLDTAAVPEAARQWATSGVFWKDPGDAGTEFLLALSDLARRAAAAGDRLYCRWSY
jgi:hypothetical protein